MCYYRSSLFMRGREEIGSYDQKKLRIFKQFTGILGFEITGYEVPETNPKTATPQP